jgi:putative RNA 2'-phosphotransferase
MNQTPSNGPADVRASKFLALVLRHDPGRIGIELDPAGWVPVDTLLTALKQHGRGLSRERLDRVVAAPGKKRYEYDESRTLIRASQGHSVTVDLGYTPSEPPAVLYHGTATRFLDSIFREGIQRGKRHHVHLSRDTETAATVGARHGKPAVLSVDAARMGADGHVFYLSTNGVWLTDHVAPEYLAHFGTSVGTDG